MSLAHARQLADAVLFEGYVLYPYRASSAKNRYRWAFGVLAPRDWSEAGGCESWWMEAQCLVEASGPVELEGRLRFLQAQARRVEEAVDASGTAFRPTERLEVGGQLLLAWEEGEVREVPFGTVLAEAGSPEQVHPFEVPGGEDVEPVCSADGAVKGRVVRQRRAVGGRVRVSAEPVDAARRLLRVRVRVENLTPWSTPEAPREEALRAACLGAHLLLSVRGGAFVSLLDPPGWALAAAARSKSVGTFPVLAGAPGSRDLVLSAPFILYDHAQVAPESPGDLFDATEIDEILTLRTSLLTDEERRQARATDARAAALLARVDSLPPELVDRLHGAIRELHRGEMVPRRAAAPTVAPGTRVRLRPGRRRTDAQDLLFAGCIATVQKVEQDLEGRELLAVTLDDDPAAELHDWYGRYHYYALDEVEVLSPGEEARR